MAAGRTWNGSNFDFAIARYNIDGTLDNTFSSDGTQTTDFNAQNDLANAIAIQSDGKIVIGGSAIVRYNTDGSLDNTFSTDGIQSNTHYIASLAIQSDGKIVVAGYRVEEDHPRAFTLSRYNSDGRLDNTFGESGIVYNYEMHFSYSYATSLAIQRDGKIVAAGGGNNFSPWHDDNDYVIIRYNTDGSLDNTFGLYGSVSDETYSNYVAKAVAIQSNGTIVAVVESAGRGGDQYAGVALVSYDTYGRLIKDMRTRHGDYAIEHATSVAVQSDDKIVVAGRSEDYFALIRFNKDLSVDSSFSGDGKQMTDAIRVNGGINSIAIANNKLYAVGSNTSFGNYGVVARYLLAANKAPVVSITSPANNVVYSAPATINISAKATDADGKISNVKFYRGTTLLHTEYIAPYNFIWRDVPAGNYTLTAKATDNLGLVTTSAAVHISIVLKKAPTVRIIKPHNDQSFSAPAYISLKANAKDPGGRITRVEFYNGSTLLSTEYRHPCK